MPAWQSASTAAVRRKGEQSSLVSGLIGGLVETGDEPPDGEEYPADDDVPESEY